MGAARHFAEDSSALSGESEPEVDNVLTANPPYIGLGCVWRAGFGMQVLYFESPPMFRSSRKKAGKTSVYNQFNPRFMASQAMIFSYCAYPSLIMRLPVFVPKAPSRKDHSIT